MEHEEAARRLLLVLHAVSALAPKATVARVVDLLTDAGLASARHRREWVAGRLRHVPRAVVFALIGEALERGWLERRAARRRREQGLGLTEAGRQALRRDQQLFPQTRLRSWWASCLASLRSLFGFPHGRDDLLLALLAWRKAEADRRGMAPRRFLSDRVLYQLHERRPFYYSDLLRIPALRRRVREWSRWAPALLDCVAAVEDFASELLIPEDESGVVLEGPFLRGLALDHHVVVEGESRAPTRIGDLVAQLQGRRALWAADVLAVLLVRLLGAQCADLARPTGVICADTALGAPADPATRALADALARELAVSALDALVPTAPPFRPLLIDLVARSNGRLAQAAARLQAAGAEQVIALAATRAAG